MVFKIKKITIYKLVDFVKIQKRACRALRKRSFPKHRKRSFRKSFLSAELFQERSADGSVEQIKNEI